MIRKLINKVKFPRYVERVWNDTSIPDKMFILFIGVFASLILSVLLLVIIGLFILLGFKVLVLVPLIVAGWCVGAFIYDRFE